MSSKLFRLVLAVTLMFLAISPAWANEPSVSIDHVAGREVADGQVKGVLSGKALVEGTALLSAPEQPRPPQKPLIADAGDSAFVASGSPAPLLGSGYGGTEPYSFAWSSPVGTIEGADAPTAQLRTEGLSAGVYDVRLTITDAAGNSASDIVKVVVYQASLQELLNETRVDSTPGVIGAGAPGTLEFPFDVPANTTKIDVTLNWTIDTNDYDLRVMNPDGTRVASSAGGVPQTSERTGVQFPVPGTWTAVVEKFATVADTVSVVVTGTIGPDDPRPSVDAGGPYRFAIDAPQTLSGSVSGGAAPVTVGWDTDADGVLDQSGATISPSLPAGRHVVTFKAVDATGLERRETVVVLVAEESRLAAETTAVTVIAINDTGINPYHLEFSAQTYPDPDVLELTRNFTRHPSEYIPGYPASAKALPITLDKGYFPAEDSWMWTPDYIKTGELYWIPGTKIIGAIDAGGSTGATSGSDPHPILDNHGHGTGSASVSTGNRYGYCPTCLLVVVEALDETPAAQLPWVDISSNSFGPIGGAPVGLSLQLLGLDPAGATRMAAERGQLVLFAAGNGVANAFDVPVSTYTADGTGPSWTITVGAIRRDVERGIVGDGIPVDISAWGDGNLPSACRTGTVSQCAFGGTSAATPYTAGVFGTVLSEVRRQVGDSAAGQKPGQVVAEGFALEGSPYLQDGKLTRAELREAVLKTAYPLNTDNETGLPIYPYPLTAPYAGDINVLFEGYGAATPESARRAIDVLLGRAQLPDRSFEDAFFALDAQIRDSLWGGFDRDGDGDVESAAPLGAFELDVAAVETPETVLETMRRVAALSAPALPAEQTLGANALRFYLHRTYEAEPSPDTTVSCSSNVQFMDNANTAGDLELCFDSRITSVLAAYRPVGIFPSAVDLETVLPAGSDVFVELFMTGETPSVIRPTGVLMAGDREIGTGSATPAPVLGTGVGGAGCSALGEACWTKYTFAFKTTRPAIIGDQLTFQVQLLGARSWAFGYEGQHASRITIVAAPMPETGLEFGATIASPSAGEEVPYGPVTAAGSASFPDLGEGSEAGDHPTRKRVEVAVDDPSFSAPIEATLDEASGAWSAPLGRLSAGHHTIYVRAGVDTNYSAVTSRSFVVAEQPVDAQVEWQVVPAGATPTAEGWQPANGLVPFAFEVNTRLYGKGTFHIYARLVENGQQTAVTFVEARFSGR